MQSLAFNTVSRSMEFTAKRIYTVGPESRKVIPGQVDKTWKFIFVYDDDHQYVFVSTYRTQTYKLTNDATQMVISVKQASLLAMNTFSRICVLSAANNMFILTPLTGAIFSREDREEISAIFNTDPSEAVVILNSSCQSGGQYLPYSDGSTTIVAAFAATRDLKDGNLGKSIVTKITKQYLRAQKKINTALIPE